MPQTKYAYGWKAQRPDKRDLKLSLPHISTADLPASVDLRPSMPPVYDQGQLGSCTANAIAAAVQYLCMKANYKWPFTPSRLFIYYNERVMEGTVLTDSGAQLRDGLTALNKQGICPEAEGDGTTPDWLWPYSDNQLQFRLPPPAQCYKDAVLHAATKFEACPLDAPTMQSTLAQGLPIIFGITVYSSFEGGTVATDGMVPMPNTDTESVLGGHALLCVGYETINNELYFIFRNSWSASWGVNGYGYIPAAYLTDPDLASDFWVLQDVGINSQATKPEVLPHPELQGLFNTAAAGGWESEAIMIAQLVCKLGDAVCPWIEQLPAVKK
jgi:C1A family cysteine protease